MTELLKDAINYVRENIDMDHVRVTCADIDKQHGSLASCDIYDLETDIRDLMEEYDETLPEGWWESEMEVEDIFYALMEESERDNSEMLELEDALFGTSETYKRSTAFQRALRFVKENDMDVYMKLLRVEAEECGIEQ